MYEPRILHPKFQLTRHWSDDPLELVRGLYRHTYLREWQLQKLAESAEATGRYVDSILLPESGSGPQLSVVMGQFAEGAIRGRLRRAQTAGTCRLVDFTVRVPYPKLAAARVDAGVAELHGTLVRRAEDDKPIACFLFCCHPSFALMARKDE